MDCHHCITNFAERKKGEHLRMEDRGAIKALWNQGPGIRAIARQIGCAPGTVTNELKRGTPPRKSNKGKAPGYSPKQGATVYKAHRANSHRHLKADSCKPFIAWVTMQVREHKWSLDACCGYAKRQRLFSGNEMVCTHTFYNMAGAGLLSIQITELPEALKRKPRKTRDRKNKRRTTLPSASPARPARPCWRPCLSSGLSMVNVSHRSLRRLPWTTEASLPTLLR